MADRRKAKKASPNIFCEGYPPKRPREIEALTEEDVRRFLQDENVDFLNCMREYCDIRRIAASLLSKNMIGRGQFDNLIKASTPEEAASLCYSFLYSDPSVNKLEKLSTALREDERCDSHKRLAEKIDQFLQQGQGIILPSTSSMCSQVPQQSPNTPPDEHQAGPSSSSGRPHSSLLPETQAGPSSSPGRPHSSLLPVTQAGPSSSPGRPHSSLLPVTQAGPSSSPGRSHSFLLPITQAGPSSSSGRSHSSLLPLTQTGPSSSPGRPHSSLLPVTQAGPSSSPGRPHSSLLPVTQAGPSSSPGRPHSSLLPVTQAGPSSSPGRSHSFLLPITQAGPSSSSGRSHSSLLPLTQTGPSSSPGRPHSSLLPLTQTGLPPGEEALQIQHIQQLTHSNTTHQTRQPAPFNPNVAGHFGLPLANPLYHSNPYLGQNAQPYQRQQPVPHPSVPEGELPSQQLAPQTFPLSQGRLTIQSQYAPQEMGNSVMYQHTTPSNHPMTHPPVIQYPQGPRPPATPPRSHVSPHPEQQMTRPPLHSVPTETHQSQVDPFPHYLRPPIRSALFLEEPLQTSPRSFPLPHQMGPRSSLLPHQTSSRSFPLPHQTSPRSFPLPHQMGPRSSPLPHHSIRHVAQENSVSLQPLMQSQQRDISDTYQPLSDLLHKYYTEKMKVVPTDTDIMFIELAVVGREKRLRKKQDLCDFLQAAIEGIDIIHERSKTIDYKNLLSYDEQNSGKRIIISGAPGCGKTTLSRKICKDLCSQELKNDYKLVILVHLRELSLHVKEEELQLHHLLKKYASDRVNIQLISKIIEETNGKGVILVLDGYDEISDDMKKSQFMQNILKSSSLYLSECDIVITSCPVTMPELLSDLEGPGVHVEILGFKTKQIHSYIKSYFNQNGQLAAKLIEKLKDLPSVCGMCRIPVILQIVCRVQDYLGEAGLPHTMSGIYAKYIFRQLIEFIESIQSVNPLIQGVSVTDLLNIPSNVFPHFTELCEMAYKFSVNQKLVLSQSDLSAALRGSAHRGSIYGLLTTESVNDLFVPGLLELYMFTHKTVQEALAAVYVAKQTPEKQWEIWKEQFGRTEMVEVWKFYCGFTKLLHFDLLKLVNSKSRQSERERKALPPLLMISLYEADSEDLARAVFTDAMFKDITFSSSSAYETAILGYCLQFNSNIEKLEFKAKRSPIQVELALPAVLSHKNLKELTIQSLGKSDLAKFEECLKGCESSSLQTLKIGDMAADFVIPVFLSLSKMPFLTDIECKDKDALRKISCDQSTCDLIEKSLKESALKSAEFSTKGRFSHELIASIVYGLLCNNNLVNCHIEFLYSVKCTLSSDSCTLDCDLQPKQLVKLLHALERRNLKDLIITVSRPHFDLNESNLVQHYEEIREVWKILKCGAINLSFKDNTPKDMICAVMEGVAENDNDLNLRVTVRPSEQDSITSEDSKTVTLDVNEHIKPHLSAGVSEMFNWEEEMCSLKPLHIRQSLIKRNDPLMDEPSSTRPSPPVSGDDPNMEETASGNNLESAFDGLEMDEEDPAMLEPWIDVYNQVLKIGHKITQHIIHCITLGSSGVGKTWLKNLLTGRPNSTTIPSTECIVPPDICLPKEIYVEDDTHCSWKLLTAEEELKAIISEFNVDTSIFDQRQSDFPASYISIDENEEDYLMHTEESPVSSLRDEMDDRTVQLQLPLQTHETSHEKSPDAVTEADSQQLHTKDLKDEAEQKQSKSSDDLDGRVLSPEDSAFSTSFLDKIESLRREIKYISPIKLDGKAVIYFTDTGGQQSFHEIHPSLLTAPRSVYLIVMKLHDLDPQDEIKTKHKLDLVERTLRNIYLANKPSFKSKYGVILVGTHKDEVDNVKDRLEFGNRLIKEMVAGKAYEKLLPDSIIAIDSSQAGIPIDRMKNNEGVMTLLEKGERGFQLNKDIPLCWWLFHLYIRHLFEYSPAQERQWAYEYNHLQELAKEVGISSDTSKDADKSISEFYSMVKLFNNLGFWVYFEPKGIDVTTSQPKNWIITSPNMLYKYVSKLVNIQEREISHDQSETFQLAFKRTGFFYQSILKEISEDQLLNYSIEVQQWFLDLLIHLNIGAECWDYEICTEGPSKEPVKLKDPYYIIPAAFPEDKSITIPEHKSVASLYVKLNDIGCIPTGIYCNLIAYLVSTRKEYDSQFVRISGYSRTLKPTSRQRAIAIFSGQYGKVYLTETTDAICIDLVADSSYFHKVNKILELLFSICSKWRNIINKLIKTMYPRQEILWQVKCEQHDQLATVCLGSDDSIVIACDEEHIASADQVAWFTNQVPSNAKSCNKSEITVIMEEVHEIQLKDLCWIPFGINSFQVETKIGGKFNLSPHVSENSPDYFWLKVYPNNSDKSNTQVLVHYGCIITGPFVLPDGYKLVSPVLYLDMKTDLFCKPLDLHMPHWSSDPASVRYITAPHVPNPEGKYVFKLRDNVSTAANLKIVGSMCLFAPVIKLSSPENYFITWWKKESVEDMQYRAVATYDSADWISLLDKEWKNFKWIRDTNNQPRKFQFLSNKIYARLQPKNCNAKMSNMETIQKQDVQYSSGDVKKRVKQTLYPPFICIESEKFSERKVGVCNIFLGRKLLSKCNIPTYYATMRKRSLQAKEDEKIPLKKDSSSTTSVTKESRIRDYPKFESMLRRHLKDLDHWKTVLAFLGVPLRKCNFVLKKNQGDHNEAFIECLFGWVNLNVKDTKGTWSELFDALKEGEEVGMAVDLEEEIFETPSLPESKKRKQQSSFHSPPISTPHQKRKDSQRGSKKLVGMDKKSKAKSSLKPKRMRKF